ncbi:MAG: hypothetical protein FWD04_11370 [Conexibacteraceae bacterium]|nr:hypothetical protein [Conexibacteraceae bacterium]
MPNPDDQPVIDPIAYVALAAAAAAAAALELADLDPDEQVTANADMSPADALIAMHQAAEDLDLARRTGDRTNIIETLAIIETAGRIVVHHFVEQASGKFGGDTAAMINASRAQVEGN